MTARRADLLLDCISKSTVFRTRAGLAPSSPGQLEWRAHFWAAPFQQTCPEGSHSDGEGMTDMGNNSQALGCLT